MTLTSNDLARALAAPSTFAPMLTIMDKWAHLRRFKHNRLQRHFFTRYSLGQPTIDLVVKARQATVTTAVLGESLRLVLTRPTRALTLMDAERNTTTIREVLDRMYDSIPEALQIGARTIAKPHRYIDNRTTNTYSNGSRWILGTAGAVNVGRSTTVDLLHGSEVAHWTDAKYIVKGAQQAAQFAIWRIYESTANGAHGWFYEAAKQAQDPKNTIYKLHFYPWWWTDEYRVPLEPGEVLQLDEREILLRDKHGVDDEQIKWKRRMVEQLGTEFDQEYPEDVETCFLQSGFGYFGNIEPFFTADLHPVYQQSHTYVAGVDFGQQRDYTVCFILDATSMQMVDIIRIRHEEWSEMRAAIRGLLKKWQVELCVAEKNSMGSSEIESLRRECDNEGLPVTIWSFDMNIATKPPVMRSYRTAMREGGLRLQDIPYVKSEHREAKSKLTSKGWTVESPRDQDAETGELSGHGDTVVAGALAVKAASGIAA